MSNRPSDPVVLATDVAALYVDPRGPYPGLVREWFDAKRNAMTYRGDLPVVAHPPCGPWSRLSQLHKSAEEIAFAPHALAVVQRCGGVLEHPKGSKLWDACGLPKPGDNVLFNGRRVSSRRDEHGGYTIEVAQCDWGHPARKRTWLYVVGVDWRQVVPGIRTGGTATHRVTSGPRGPQLPTATKKKRIHTPPAFARWLVELAQAAEASHVAA